MNPDSDAFQRFERSGWDRSAAAYADHWGELTRQSAEVLLDSTEVTGRSRVLDVASGPGWVAARAAERGARTIGVDISVTMMAQATQRYPHLPFMVGDAEELPLQDDCVDAVVMNYGLLHLGRPEQAMQEALRVLRPGGRAAFTVWAPPVEAMAFQIVLGAVEAYGSPAPLPVGPPFFRFSDASEFASTLVNAGFTGPIVKRVAQTWRLPNPEALYDAMRDGTVRTAGLLRAQTDAAARAIRKAVTEGAERYLTDDGVRLPMPAMLGSAAKPG